MKKELKAGDNVEWKAEDGRARGAVLKKLTTLLRLKSITITASKKEPKYFIRRAKTGLVVLKKGSALKIITENKVAQSRKRR